MNNRKTISLSDLASMRGKIIDNFSSVEMIISSYISRYYFGKDNFDFIHTVLYNSHMNNMSRIKIFKKLLSKNGMDKKKIENLMRKIKVLTKIRNIFAHCWVSSPNPLKGFSLIGPDGMNDTVKIKEQFDQFFSKFTKTQKEILALLTKHYHITLITDSPVK